MGRRKARVSGRRQRSTYESEIPQQNFQLFQKLAPEIRLKVWQHALASPRIVEAISEEELKDDVRDGDTYDSDGERENQVERNFDWLTSTPPPSLLHVCRESRQVASGSC